MPAPGEKMEQHPDPGGDRREVHDLAGDTREGAIVRLSGGVADDQGERDQRAETEQPGDQPFPRPQGNLERPRPPRQQQWKNRRAPRPSCPTVVAE